MRQVILIAFISFLSVTESMAQFSGGTGNTNDPYQISTVSDLEKLTLDVNAGNAYEGKYFIQTQNINLSGIQFKPVGKSELTPFKGYFDGAKKTISNLTIVSGYNDVYSGLFGFAVNAELKNISVENGRISGGGSNIGYSCTGGILACGKSQNDSLKVENCTYSGIVTSGATEKTHTGGIIGAAIGTGTVPVLLIGCRNTAIVNGVGDTSCTGGIMGRALFSAEIKKCLSGGQVNGIGHHSRTGGILGQAGGNMSIMIDGCCNIEELNGVGTAFVSLGGILGSNDNGGNTTVKNCFSAAPVNGSGAPESISKEGDFAAIGGIIGSGHSAGALTVAKCHNYSWGQVTTGKRGAIFGYLSGNTTIASCYWNQNVNAELTGTGECASNINISGVVALSADYFKLSDSFNKDANGAFWANEADRWNIGSSSSAWNFISGNNKYPQLTELNNTTSSIAQIKSAGIAVYPNPTSGQFTISSHSSFLQNISIYDMSGRLLLVTTDKNIDISSFHSGIYFVKVDHGIIKVIKE